jgi:hypothetical protein
MPGLPDKCRDVDCTWCQKCQAPKNFLLVSDDVFEMVSARAHRPAARPHEIKNPLTLIYRHRTAETACRQG